LEVEPAQAQMIVLLMASSENALTLSLRNNDDNERVQIPSATIYEVLGPDAAIFRTPAGRR
jgi:Flp pilus assembly protein CpaB